MMKMMTFSDFQVRWKDIPYRENSFLTLEITHPLNLQIGRAANYYKSLAVMNSGKIKDIPSSYAVRAVNPPLANGDFALEFQLVHDAFDEEFQRLCWDMIEVTVESHQPLKDMIARYMTWQKLLQYRHTGALSFENQKGLLGELLYFEELLSTMTRADAVNAWCGPDGSDQDYVMATTWTEIKTVALAATTVKISSLQQLDQEINGMLKVYVLEKSTEGPDRVTLPDVVSRIKAALTEEPQVLDRFEMKLFKYGYRQVDEDEYRKNWFRLVESREFSVTDDFPKLTRKNVPSGVEGCTYDLSLLSLEPFRR